jgi:hypothetical protein
MKTLEPSLAALSLIKQAEIINANLDRLHDIINKAERGAMGLTLDSSKTPEWSKAKHEYDMMFSRLRAVNSQLNKLRKCVGYEAVNGKRVAIYQYKDNQLTK